MTGSRFFTFIPQAKLLVGRVVGCEGALVALCAWDPDEQARELGS
jgi:hypothetical protein